MLKDKTSSAIVGVSDLNRARAFYADMLGLELAASDEAMLSFKTGTSQLTVYVSENFRPSTANAVAWGAGGDRPRSARQGRRAGGISGDGPGDCRRRPPRRRLPWHLAQGPRRQHPPRQQPVDGRARAARRRHVSISVRRHVIRHQHITQSVILEVQRDPDLEREPASVAARTGNAPGDRSTIDGRHLHLLHGLASCPVMTAHAGGTE